MAGRIKKRVGATIPKSEFDKRIYDIETAIEVGALSYPQISQATGLSINQIYTAFKKSPATYAKYKKALMSVQLQAVSNLVDILGDKTHPQHFSATKHVLTKYKTELDEVLTKSDEEDVMRIEAPRGCPVQINFTSQSKPEED